MVRICIPRPFERLQKILARRTATKITKVVILRCSAKKLFSRTSLNWQEAPITKFHFKRLRYMCWSGKFLRNFSEQFFIEHL